MKTCLRLLPTQSRWLLSFCLGAWLGFQFMPADARLKVTTSVSANVKVPHGLGSSSPQNYLCCEGYKTFICRDENGKTQVYVNDDGGDFSTEEKYRVEIDDLDMDWTDFTIYAGNHLSSGTIQRAEIKVVGGHVGAICLSGLGARTPTSKNIVYSSLEVTGGMVESIRAAQYPDHVGLVNIVLSGMKYAGNMLVNDPGCVGEAYLNVSLDCEFYQPGARMTPTRCPALWSIIMPDSATWTKLVAMGSYPEVSEDEEITCPVLEDHSINNLTIYGTLHLTSCNGWQSSRPLSNYANHVTIPAHKPISYLIRPATCTSPAQYKSYCSVCGVDIVPNFPTEALGHVEVPDRDYPATCYSTGRTGGTHCARCGEVMQAATIIEKTEHEYVDEIVSADIIAKGCYQVGGKGVAMTKHCKNCYHLEMVSGTEGTHDWKELGPGVLMPSSISKLVLRLNRSSTCYVPGIRAVRYCKECSLLQTETTAPGHDFSLHVGTEPTCQANGVIAYQVCTECEDYFLPDASITSPYYVSSDYFIRRALGHQYGVLPATNDPNAFISAATCTEPAKYWDVCAVCGEMSDQFTVTGTPATGHKYRIQQIDFVSPEFPTDGDLTLECEHCGHTVSDLGFSVSAQLGTPSLGYRDGYWCKSKLVETTQLPTCIHGEGIYEAVINYKGNRLIARYQNFVPACGYLHNYGPDGICHETHYKYKMDAATGKIEKDQYGRIVYQSSRGELIPDEEAVYASTGYVAVPYEAPRVRQSNIINARTTLTDPEDGSVMTYTEYRVTQFEEPADLLSVPQSQVEPFYLGTFGELWYSDFPDMFANPLMLGLDVHGAETVYCLADGAPYRSVSALPVSILEYTRTFSNTHWQPLYVPFPMSVAELEARHLQVARLNDTHMYDDDFNGTIDRVSLEFIRVASGELLPSRPYLVRATQTNLSSYYYFESTVMQPARETSIECSTVDQKITITGTYEGLPAGVLFDNNYYAMNSQGSLQRAASAAATLKPQRWYLKIENKDGSPLRESDYFAAEVRVLGASDEEEESTGIDALSQQPSSTAPALYRLDGTRLSTSSPVGPGIYVSDGKRIMIRKFVGE
ncbi:MAG: hypothetical protein J6X31_09910 [Bacteroidales bacterium]|nr:hypothetical protein [Bacteroidales bacterium]